MVRTRIDRHGRETFIAALLAAVPTATRADALRLLRWARTYGRLAEAECNGDYPADNGERPTVLCAFCESGWAKSACRRLEPFQHGERRYECPSCRAERIIRETCARFALHPHGATVSLPWVTPHFQGDPRGHTVRLQIAGAPLDAYERPALAVPTS